mmetsp:Transcript_54255/g.118311  ORF Transcript_54255/g.118311 Transcript_54255/m.118311 type:complete len:89 (+) Transcript_54255:3-269(+)
MVTPFPLLLFGGEITVQHARQTISVDSWIEFAAPPRVAVLIKHLRREIDRLLLRKIAAPDLELAHMDETVAAVVTMLDEEEVPVMTQR